MLMIEDEKKNEITINKSKFINYIIPLKNIDDVKNKLDSLKKEYKDATHHCFAYIFDNIKHFSDDGEPSGTAGMPLLNVLESKNLNHVLTVTIRYFGGIKLGAGGLVRAYTKSLTENLNKCQISNYEKKHIIEFEFEYSQKEYIESLHLNVLSKKYDEKIIYKVICDINKFYDILGQTNTINIINQEETMIKTS